VSYILKRNLNPIIFLICCYHKRVAERSGYVRPCDRYEVINIRGLLLHIFKHLDKVAVSRLMIFQILTILYIPELTGSISPGNTATNSLAERI